MNIIKCCFVPLSLVVHFWYHTAHCMCRKDACACFCVSRISGTEGGVLGPPQGAINMMAAWFVCKKGHGPNSHPDCMNGLRKPS